MVMYLVSYREILMVRYLNINRDTNGKILPSTRIC